MTDTKPDSAKSDKFRDLAKDLGCDEVEASFEDKVRKVATAPKLEAEPEK